jgi:hypothetical protein
MTIEAGETPLRRGTAAAHDPDGSLRVTSDSGAVVVLNPTAAALWELLDGQTTVDEVVTAATSLFAASGDDIRDDIVTIIAEMRVQKLVS